MEITWDSLPEPEVEAMPKAARLEMDRLFELVTTLSPAAEAPLRKLAAAHPEVLALQNWLMTFLSHGTASQKKEATGMIEDLFRNHPEYYFARTGLAEHHLREGRVAEAATLMLGPGNTLHQLYTERKVFHISEVRHWAYLCGQILLKQGDIRAAESYRELLFELEPESDAAMELNMMILMEGMHSLIGKAKKAQSKPGRGRRIK